MKCCPSGEIVKLEIFEDNELSPRKHFSCSEDVLVPQKFKNKRESEGYSIDNSTSSSEVIAYNVLIDKNSHWPSCNDTSFISHTLIRETTKVSQSASCVDIMAGRYHVFSCEESLEAANDFKELYKFRKCCEKDFSYDIFERRCVDNNQATDTQEFFEFFGEKAAIFESGLPLCRHDDVLVEYHELVHKLKIYESSLVITVTNSHGPDLVLQNSYCIENTLNHHYEPPDAFNQQLSRNKYSSKWIAKVCRPKEICNEMPCLRKCCKEGLRMVYDNETAICEPHHSHLNVKFHDFDFNQSPEVPEALEPTGMLNNLIKEKGGPLVVVLVVLS